MLPAVLNTLKEMVRQIVKSLLKRLEDPYLALLACCLTPVEVGYSPTELMMSCHLHTTVTAIQRQGKASIPDSNVVVTRDD